MRGRECRGECVQGRGRVLYVVGGSEESVVEWRDIRWRARRTCRERRGLKAACVWSGSRRRAVNARSWGVYEGGSRGVLRMGWAGACGEWQAWRRVEYRGMVGEGEFEGSVVERTARRSREGVEIL